MPYQQQLLQYRNNLAIAYAEVGRVADAITQSEETVLGLENLMADHPTNEQRMFLASARNNLALRDRSTGRIDAAREVAERAIDEMQTLVDNNSETPRYRLMLGGACSNQGELIRGQKKAEDAIPWYHRAMETLETVKESMPNVPTVDQFLRNTRFGLGKAHEDMDMFDQALGHYDAALAYKDVPFRHRQDFHELIATIAQ